MGIRIWPAKASHDLAPVEPEATRLASIIPFVVLAQA